nr:MAG TPA: REPLICATION INITIATION PROTEIN [Inoviridae sp.]
MSKYVLRLDYATFAFTPNSVDLNRVQQALSGGLDLGFRQFGTYDSSPFQSPLGLYYKPDCGSKENPHILQVSGSACEHFRETLPVLGKVLYDGGEQAHFRRLDFAFDVIMSRSDWRKYLSDCFLYSMEQNRQRKKFLLQGSGEAMTIYIGSRNSDRFFRVYNKTLQDPSYIFVNPDGSSVDVSDNYCVIRYEIECKRVNRTRSGQRVVSDPSPMFDWYYDDSQLLFDEVKKQWLSFGNEVMLPADFESASFVTDIDVRHLHPLSGDIASSYKEVCYANVSARLHNYPHSFEHSLEFAARRYGAYVPYILRDPRLLDLCKQAARERFGFDIDFFVDFDDTVRFEFEDLPEDACPPWSEIGEFEEIDILKGKENLTYADYCSR